MPAVIDTGTLAFRGRVVKLLGLEGQGGHLARQLANYLRRREVECAAGGPEGTRCTLDGEDLAGLILTAGGARAREDAPPTCWPPRIRPGPSAWVCGVGRPRVPSKAFQRVRILLASVEPGERRPEQRLLRRGVREQRHR